jgi:NlpC/P60 family
MSFSRDAAIKFAKQFWDKVTDDDKFGHHSDGVVSLAEARRRMNAPKPDWEAVFVFSPKTGQDKGMFRNTNDGSFKPDPFVTEDDVDDCTHYVSRCLNTEGISLTETGRANELAEAMIKSHETKTLTLKCSQAEGQKVIDSGVFKPGDLVAYFTETKGRYTHTAMFVGRLTKRTDDPGGITCHSLCRFQGLSETRNGGGEDADWFLNSDHTYTLIHFSADDASISAATKKWLPGWWKVDSEFYFVTEDGRAVSTLSKPKKPEHTLAHGIATGYYFETDAGITFVWRLPASRVRVEFWTAPSGKNAASRKVGNVPANLSAVF